jgi:hypothetical protein
MSTMIQTIGAIAALFFILGSDPRDRKCRRV